MAKIDISRVNPGTLELVRNATTGEYSVKSVGFQEINKLSVPDLGTQASTVTPTTPDESKSAADLTGTTVDTQTQTAFRIPDRRMGDTRDSTDDMLEEARKTSSMLSDTFTRPNIREVTEDRITSPLDIKSPTERVFSRPNMKDVAGDTRMTAQEAAPQEDIETADFTDYEQSLLNLTPQQKEKREPTFLKNIFGEPRGLEVARGKPEQFRGPDMSEVAGPVRTSEIPDRNRGQLGVRTTRPDTPLDMTRFEGVSRMGALSGDEKKDVKPVERNALQTFTTSLRTTGDSVLSNLKTPMMAVMDTVVGAVVSPEQQASNKFDASYFNVKSDGRIAGNASTDVFAGMNAQSMFGDKSKSAANRIETREKTIERKGYGPGDKFYDDTQKMKNQLKDYNNAKDSDKDVSAAKNEAALSRQESARTGQYDKDGGGSGGGGKVVCTMMNQRYGFGSFRNKIWLKFHKDYSPEYQKGYHKLFLPLVNIAKKEGIFSLIVRKILEHMGRHVTADMFQIMRNKKSNKLGRIYRKIFEPICYWLGGK